MDAYNSKIAKVFRFFSHSKEYAVTLGQTAYFSCPQEQVPSWWQAHEDEHKKQWERVGKVRFLTRYMWQLVTKGYANIDYEIEARNASAKAIL
jgi:hypothetical protein